MSEHDHPGTDFPAHTADIVVTDEDVARIGLAQTLANPEIIISASDIERTSHKPRLPELLTPDLLFLVAQLVAGTRLRGLRSLLLGAAIWRTIQRALRHKGSPTGHL